MSAVVADPTQQSKRSRKKKANAENPAQSAPTPADAEAGNGTADAASNGADGSYESPYIKELQKYAGVLYMSRGIANTITLVGTFVT